MGMTRPGGTPVRSYSTQFELDEDPISEGGMWLNGKADGIEWTDVVTGGGVAFGAVSRMGVAEKRTEQGNLEEAEATAPEGDYDDPTAILTGDWGPDQYASGLIFSRNQTEEYFQEAQFRFRYVLEASWCAGYEFIYRTLDNENAYCEIVRWNGNVGDWTSLARVVGPQCGIADGDFVEASCVGNVITGYINGVEILSVADDVITAGAPGIGFNFGVGDSNVDHGFRSFEVASYDH
jgi:hypothetical protein